MFKRALRAVAEHSVGAGFLMFPGLKKYTLGGVTVFIYHEVNDNPAEFTNNWGLAVSEQTFKNQITWINQNFNIVHPNCLLEQNKEPLPERAAVITFDDGFAGAFENGISYLANNSIPSLMFLNMRTVLERRPMLSALVFYLEAYSPDFSKFLKTENIGSPAFLNITPEQLEKYETLYGPINYEDAIKYQGEIASKNLIKRWGESEFVVYGNHLFDHWNSAALSSEQFIQQYQENAQALQKINSESGFFSFTNGQPETCFSNREVEILQTLGAGRIFFSKGYTNFDTQTYLLDRVFLLERENTSKRLWFRMFFDALFCRSKFFESIVRRL
ncbi:MAG: polysaccharide deacetylase family protein [Halopseudomonas aestusnigri]